MSTATDHDLDTVTVLDLDGSPVPVSQLWTDGPALVVWLRHYG